MFSSVHPPTEVLISTIITPTASLAAAVAERNHNDGGGDDASVTSSLGSKSPIQLQPTKSEDEEEALPTMMDTSPNRLLGRIEQYDEKREEDNSRQITGSMQRRARISSRRMITLRESSAANGEEKDDVLVGRSLHSTPHSPQNAECGSMIKNKNSPREYSVYSDSQNNEDMLPSLSLRSPRVELDIEEKKSSTPPVSITRSATASILSKSPTSLPFEDEDDEDEARIPSPTMKQIATRSAKESQMLQLPPLDTKTTVSIANKPSKTQVPDLLLATQPEFVETEPKLEETSSDSSYRDHEVETSSLDGRPAKQETDELIESAMIILMTRHAAISGPTIDMSINDRGDIPMFHHENVSEECIVPSLTVSKPKEIPSVSDPDSTDCELEENGKETHPEIVMSPTDELESGSKHNGVIPLVSDTDNNSEWLKHASDNQGQITGSVSAHASPLRNPAKSTTKEARDAHKALLARSFEVLSSVKLPSKSMSILSEESKDSKASRGESLTVKRLFVSTETPSRTEINPVASSAGVNPATTQSTSSSQFESKMALESTISADDNGIDPRRIGQVNGLVKIDPPICQTEKPVPIKCLDLVDIGIRKGDIMLSLLDRTTELTNCSRVREAIWRCRTLRQDSDKNWNKLLLERSYTSAPPGRLSVPVDLDDGRAICSIEQKQQAAIWHLRFDEFDESQSLYDDILHSYFRYQEQSCKNLHPKAGDCMQSELTEGKRLVGTAMHNLGIVLLMQEKWGDASTYFERATWNRSYLDDPERISSLNRTAIAKYASNDISRARVVLEEALELARKTISSLSDHHQLAEILNNLGCLAYQTGHSEQAMAYFHDSLQIQELATGHSLYIGSKFAFQVGTLNMSVIRANIGFLHLASEDTSQCISLFDAAVRGQQLLLSDAHPTLMASLEHLVTAHLLAGDKTKALQLLRRMFHMQVDMFGPNNADARVTSNKIAMLEDAVDGSTHLAEVYQTLISPKKPANKMTQE